MKKLPTFFLVIFMAFNLCAQESRDFYLLFEFMSVDDEHINDYLEVENFWSELHKQRIADGKIIGWDLWSLIPSGTKQGSQYLTVTLFSTLEKMMTPVTMDEMMDYMVKAYPDKSDAEIQEMITMTTRSRDIANQVYLKQISWTDGNFEMKPGVMATLDIMKELQSGYEQAESELFRQWHQEMVDQGKKGNWGLMRAILPAGSDVHGTHITISMYDNPKQLAEMMEMDMSDIDYSLNLAAQHGVAMREDREVKIATLQMMVR